MAAKLIFDEAAIKRISEKMKGQPIFMGPDGGLLTPGIVNLLDEGSASNRWLPGNVRTKKLVLGREACRDVLFYLERFLDPNTRKHAMNRMVVPLCMLMDVVTDLVSELNDKESQLVRKNIWPRQDYETYQKVAKRLKQTRFGSTVRKVRNKIAAHLDEDIFAENIPKLKPDDVLQPLGDSIVLLMLSMNYSSDWFCWIRPVGVLDDGKHFVVETMYSYPICVQWIADLDGHVEDVRQVVLAADPRHEISEQIMEVVAGYNSMVKAINSGLPLIKTMAWELNKPE